MTDIVWSLREDCPCISDIGCAQELCNQAAAEIEQLRQVLENIQQARVLQGKAIVDASNEIENLRLALEVAANDLDDWGAYTKAKNARAALEGE